MSAHVSSSAPLLVAILNDVRDFELARDEHWYRIRCDKADKWLSDRWPPRWLAFYQTKVFGPQSHSVTWYAEVRDIRRVRRCELFPDQPRTWKSQHWYYQLLLGPVQRRREPILSRRYRHIVFIATTGKKFNCATEINDLFDDSPLEDRLWAELKRLRIAAERQEFIGLDTDQAALDFAIYCAAGKIAVETDGDTWHANPVKAAEDNVRDNALEVHGWSLLRFTTAQIVERLNEYCIPKIVEKINALGGADEGGQIARRVELPDGARMTRKGCSTASNPKVHGSADMGFGNVRRACYTGLSGPEDLSHVALQQYESICPARALHLLPAMPGRGTEARRTRDGRCAGQSQSDAEA